MIAATACLMVGLAPGVAQAQCQIQKTPSFTEWDAVSRSTAYQGAPDGCAAIRLENAAFLDLWDGMAFCTHGVFVGLGRCEASGEGPVHVKAALELRSCGTWGGVVELLVKNKYNGSHLLPPTIVGAPLYGGACRRTEEYECQEWEIYDESAGGCIAYNSPIVIPLTRSQNYKLTSVEDGVMFDFDGNGVPEKMAWTAADSKLGFLAIDMDGDGKITSGKELVGDRIVEGKLNGFEALIALAPAGVWKLTEDQELFGRLLLWEDRNHNGVSEADELQPAGNVVTEIGLGYNPHNRRDGHGNKFMFEGRATVRTAPGKNPTTSHADMIERNIKIYDVFFKAQQ